MLVETQIYIREQLKLNLEEEKESTVLNSAHLYLGHGFHSDEVKDLRFYTYPVRHKLKFKEDLIKPLVNIHRHDSYCF